MTLRLLPQWDILSNGGVVQEMAHIANGRDHGNCVSLLRVNVRTGAISWFNLVPYAACMR
jgi:homeobox-leucine zipper protein